MLDLDKCRELLGPDITMSVAALEALRTQLYAIAAIVLEDMENDEGELLPLSDQLELDS